MEETEYTRLHITPFNSDLLKTILPPSILQGARNISYHSIPTFPEKGYGYVDLPVMDAEKIKKKLNGTILKGTKVRIDKARPQKAVVIEEEEPELPKKERKKKRKRDELPGVDIGERRVKRGWTTPAKDVEKDQPVIKSKYTTGPECLFKTNLPPNVASKGKTAEVKPDKKRKKPGKEAVVHEFAKTTKYATFLRGSTGSNRTKTVAEFVEGKGWVDSDGNVVEEAKNSRKLKPALVVDSESSDSEEEAKASAEEPEQMEVDGGEESSGNSSSADEDEEIVVSARLKDNQHQVMEQDSSSDSSSSDDESESILAGQFIEAKTQEVTQDSTDDSSDEDSDPNGASIPTPLAAENLTKEDSSSRDESSDDESVAEAQLKKRTSSSSDLSEEDSDSESSADDESEADSEVEEPQSAITNRSQGSTGPSLSIKIPESLTSTPITSSVHPLEALYKRPKSDARQPPKAAELSFSFFGADGDDEDVPTETQLQVPLTPFTQKDFEYRGIRSAAPTPDTAHPNKRFIWPSENDEDEDEDVAASSPIRNNEDAKGKGKETEPESDFQKWFYENRGDVRRAWTGRRKSAAKEKRQRENRREHRAI